MEKYVQVNLKFIFHLQGADEEDSVSLDQKNDDPLDSKQKQWILCAAKGEYHALAKMCKENAKLVKTKVSIKTKI
ncbi:Sosondowah [Operophtera brumata]|uniref:Sosondowah n=1 Tax=Operophtera brumata TaxID=104452 RepID=A0A0L7L981_OPEBR|nr:Sosondowah [Operophtera brumata]